MPTLPERRGLFLDDEVVEPSSADRLADDGVIDDDLGADLAPDLGISDQPDALPFATHVAEAPAAASDVDSLPPGPVPPDLDQSPALPAHGFEVSLDTDVGVTDDPVSAASSRCPTLAASRRRSSG